jgi:hypothetical protein
MRRRIAIVLLAIGTVGGYASGFASMRHCRSAQRSAWEHHVAKVCVDAAQGKAAARGEPDPEEL